MLNRKLECVKDSDLYNAYYQDFSGDVSYFRLMNACISFSMDYVELLKNLIILSNPRNSIKVPSDLEELNVTEVNLTKVNLEGSSFKTFRGDVEGFLKFLVELKDGKQVNETLVEIPFFNKKGWDLVNSFLNNELNLLDCLTSLSSGFSLVTLVFNPSVVDPSCRTLTLDEFYQDDYLGLTYAVDTMISLSLVLGREFRDLLTVDSVKVLYEVFKSGQKYCHPIEGLMDMLESYGDSPFGLSKDFINERISELQTENERVNRIEDVIYRSYLSGIIVDDEWLESIIKDESLLNAVKECPSNLFKLMLVNLRLC